MAQARFVDIADEEGAIHQWTIIPHPGSQGLDLSLKLYGLIVQHAGQAVADFVMRGEGEGSSDEAILKALPGLGAWLSTGAQPLVYELLRHTRRDGLPLGERAQFDIAFQANYSELWQGLWEVIKANGFFGPLRGWLAKAQARMLKGETP